MEIQHRLARLCEENDSETLEYSSDSQPEEDHLSQMSEESSTDEAEYEELSNLEEAENKRHKNYFLGRDKQTIWNKAISRPQAIDIVTQLPRVASAIKTRKTPFDCWDYFMNSEMLQLIVHCTNKKIENTVLNSQALKVYPFMKTTNLAEIKALIGLLYLAGIFKSNRQRIENLWRTDGTGTEIFHITMTYQRFYFLQNCLRFDDIATRSERLKTDKLAAIRQIFSMFVEKCKSAYMPTEYCTIDEKLDKFYGKCAFRQYIPNKPARFGLRSFILADAKTFYTLNMEIYVGSQVAGPYMVSNKPHDVVERLIEPISGTKRNVTFGSWFGDYSTMLHLLHEHNLSAVCTLRKNKPEIPAEFYAKGRRIYSNMFGFQEDLTILSYIPKRRKNITLLSSLHKDSRIDRSTGEQSKAEILTFYDSTKGGVDSIDQLCSYYDVSRNCKRWPLTIFYSLLNIAGINSAIVHTCNSPLSDINVRNEFLRQLGLELIKDLLVERKQNTRIYRDIRKRIASHLGNGEGVPEKQMKRGVGRCEECPRKKDRKTKFSCARCYRRLCMEHFNVYCATCATFDEALEDDDE